MSTDFAMPVMYSTSLQVQRVRKPGGASKPQSKLLGRCLWKMNTRDQSYATGGPNEKNVLIVGNVR